MCVLWGASLGLIGSSWGGTVSLDPEVRVRRVREAMLGVDFGGELVTSVSIGVAGRLSDRLERFEVGDVSSDGSLLSVAATLLFLKRDPIVSPVSLDSTSGRKQVN